MSRLRAGALALSVALGCASLAPAARAETGDETTVMAWSITATELSMAGVAYAAFGTDLPVGRGAWQVLNFTPIAVGVGVGYAAYRLDPSPVPALAFHGAGWGALDGFMIGALIDGRDRESGVRIGGAAWALGALGAVAGGAFGATAVDGEDRVGYWLGGPPAGFAAGGLLLGGVLALAAKDTDQASGRFTLGATIGLSLGLALGAVAALTDDDPAQPAATARPRARMFQLTGRF